MRVNNGCDSVEFGRKWFMEINLGVTVRPNLFFGVSKRK